MKKHVLRWGTALLAALSFSGCSTPEPIQVPPEGITMTDDYYLEWEAIPAELTLNATTTVADDVEFKLGENRHEGALWQVVDYDLKQCRIKIDHDGEDVWPLRHDEAEIEIHPLIRGEFTVKMQCGEKRAVIRVKSL